MRVACAPHLARRLALLLGLSATSPPSAGLTRCFVAAAVGTRTGAALDGLLQRLERGGGGGNKDESDVGLGFRQAS